MKKLLIAMLSLGLAATAMAAAPAGVVTSVSGKVSLYAAAKAGKSASLQPGAQLYAGDRLLTGANGRAALVLTDGTLLKVNYNTDITLKDTDSKGKASERGIARIAIALGGLWAKVTKKNSRLEFEAPAAVAAVKGTELSLEVTLDELCAKLKEGKLDVNNALGSSSLTQLQMLCVAQGHKPGAPQAWGGDDGWSDDVGGATSAQVEIKFNDGGQDKSVKLDYGK